MIVIDFPTLGDLDGERRRDALEELARRQREAMVRLERSRVEMQLQMSRTAGALFDLRKERGPR